MEDVTLIQPVASKLLLRSLKDGTEFLLKGEMLVGREAECGIPLHEGHVSRYHAKITVAANGIFIEDLKSTNGTYVNGHRISNRHPLSLGDEVVFHETAFRITSADSGKEDVTLMETPDGLAHIQNEPSNGKPTASRPTVAKPGAAQPATSITAEPPQATEEEGESTRMLSLSHLGQLVERSERGIKAIHDVGSGPRFIVLTAPLRGKIYPLSQPLPDNQWSIGRGLDRDIHLEDRTISQDHAKLSKTVNGWLITASHAKNGLIVNGQPVSRAFLAQNDRIRLGRIELCFKTDSEHEAEKKARESEAALRKTLKNTRRLAIIAGTVLALATGVTLGLVFL